MTEQHPTVSVVVPVKDSIRTIEACLRSIRAQTWPSVELVVIDNFSTDGTWEIVQKYDRISVKVEARKWNNIKKSLLISCWNLKY